VASFYHFRFTSLDIIFFLNRASFNMVDENQLFSMSVNQLYRCYLISIDAKFDLNICSIGHGYHILDEE
jgi:hypothetical protein